MNNELNLETIAAEVQAQDLAQAPQQHPLRTPLCPPLVQFPRGARNGWPDQYRDHTPGCIYCQKLHVMQWGIDPPTITMLAKYAAGQLLDELAMKTYLESSAEGAERSRLLLRSRRLQLLRDCMVLFSPLSFVLEHKIEDTPPVHVHQKGPLNVTLFELDRKLWARIEHPSGIDHSVNVHVEFISGCHSVSLSTPVGPDKPVDCELTSLEGLLDASGNVEDQFERIRTGLDGCVLLVDILED